MSLQGYAKLAVQCLKDVYIFYWNDWLHLLNLLVDPWRIWSSATETIAAFVAIPTLPTAFHCEQPALLGWLACFMQARVCLLAYLTIHVADFVCFNALVLMFMLETMIAPKYIISDASLAIDQASWAYPGATPPTRFEVFHILIVVALSTIMHITIGWTVNAGWSAIAGRPFSSFKVDQLTNIVIIFGKPSKNRRWTWWWALVGICLFVGEMHKCVLNWNHLAKMNVIQQQLEPSVLKSLDLTYNEPRRDKTFTQLHNIVSNNAEGRDDWFCPRIVHLFMN